MSLSLALAQIQKPTWWYEGDRYQPKKTVSQATIDKRREIVEWLREQGRKVEGLEVQRHFGITNSQMWHFLDPLVRDGTVKKYKPRHDKSLLEVV